MARIKLSHPLLLNPIALEQPSTKQENFKNLKILVGFGQPISQIQSPSPILKEVTLCICWRPHAFEKGSIFLPIYE